MGKALFIIAGHKAFVGDDKLRIRFSVVAGGIVDTHIQRTLVDGKGQGDFFGGGKVARSGLFQQNIRNTGGHHRYLAVLDGCDTCIFNHIVDRRLVVVGRYHQPECIVAIELHGHLLDCQLRGGRFYRQGSGAVRQRIVLGRCTTHPYIIGTDRRFGLGITFGHGERRERCLVIAGHKAFVSESEFGIFLAIETGGIDRSNRQRSFLDHIGKEVGDTLRIVRRGGLHGNNHGLTGPLGGQHTIYDLHHRRIGDGIDDFALGIVRRDIEPTGFIAVNSGIGGNNGNNRRGRIDSKLSREIFDGIIGRLGSFGSDGIGTDRRQRIGLPTKYGLHRQRRGVVVVNKTGIGELSCGIGFAIGTLGIDGPYREHGFLHDNLYRIGAGQEVLACILNSHQRCRSHAHNLDFVVFHHSHSGIKSLEEQLLLVVVFLHFGQGKGRLSVSKGIDPGYFEMRRRGVNRKNTVDIGKVVIGRLGSRSLHDIVAHLGIGTGFVGRYRPHADSRSIVVVDKAAEQECKFGILLTIETRGVGYRHREHRLVDSKRHLYGIGGMVIGRLVLINRENSLSGTLYNDTSLGKCSHGIVVNKGVQLSVGIGRGQGHRLAAVDHTNGIAVDNRRELIDRQHGTIDIDQLVIVGRTTRKGNGILTGVGIGYRCGMSRR